MSVDSFVIMCNCPGETKHVSKGAGRDLKFVGINRKRDAKRGVLCSALWVVALD